MDRVRLNDVVFFDVPLHTPDGSGISNADETPRFWVVENATETPIIAASALVLRAGWQGWYKGEFPVTTVLGFDVQGAYQVMVSGKVQGRPGFSIESRFRVENNSFDSIAPSSVYHADINFIRDPATDNNDLYFANWYKDGVWQSGGVTNVSISVTSKDNVQLITPKAMTAIGQGSWKYTAAGAEKQTLGELYNVVSSGTIDGSTRVFAWLLGRDTSV